MADADKRLRALHANASLAVDEPPAVSFTAFAHTREQLLLDVSGSVYVAPSDPDDVHSPLCFRCLSCEDQLTPRGKYYACTSCGQDIRCPELALLLDAEERKIAVLRSNLEPTRLEAVPWWRALLMRFSNQWSKARS